MQPPTVGLEVGHDFEGCDLCIESLGILQVIIPNLVDDVVEEFGDAMFGRLVALHCCQGGIFGWPWRKHRQQLWHSW